MKNLRALLISEGLLPSCNIASGGHTAAANWPHRTKDTMLVFADKPAESYYIDKSALTWWLGKNQGIKSPSAKYKQILAGEVSLPAAWRKGLIDAGAEEYNEGLAARGLPPTFKKFSNLSKVSHRPILATPSALKSGLAFMTYKIDAAANNSKFYEGMISEQPDGTWLYQRRWGALTDDGPDRRRVDGAGLDKYGLDFTVAKKLLDAEYVKRLKNRGYSDAMKTRPVGQYPVGLSRSVGFGWGTQGIAKSVAELRRLSALVSEARVDVNQDNAPALLADLRQIQSILEGMPNSSMAGEIRKLLRPPVSRLELNPRFIADPTKTQRELMTLKRYIDRQLLETNA